MKSEWRVKGPLYDYSPVAYYQVYRLNDINDESKGREIATNTHSRGLAEQIADKKNKDDVEHFWRFKG